MKRCTNGKLLQKNLLLKFFSVILFTVFFILLFGCTTNIENYKKILDRCYKMEGGQIFALYRRAEQDLYDPEGRKMHISRSYGYEIVRGIDISHGEIYRFFFIYPFTGGVIGVWEAHSDLVNLENNDPDMIKITPLENGNCHIRAYNYK